MASSMIPRPHLPFLYRDRNAGWIAGVCAGLSEATGIQPLLLRLSMLAGALFYPAVSVLVYALLTIFLRDRRRPVATAALPAKAQNARIAAMHSEYSELRDRLSVLEAEALSHETELRSRFKEAGLS